VRLLDDDLAAHDPVINALEFLDPVANPSLNRFTSLDIVKRDFDRDLHELNRCIARAT
jgi:hypothetical protein